VPATARHLLTAMCITLGCVAGVPVLAQMPGAAQGPNPFIDDPIPPALDWREPLPTPEAEMVMPEAVEDVPAELVSGAASPDIQYELGFPLPVDGLPTPVESSGTWLRRGCRYGGVDFMLLHRTVAGENTRLAKEETFNPGSDRQLVIINSRFDVDAVFRATLGQFIMRDIRNRDHFHEFSAIAGGSWAQDDIVQSALPNALVTGQDGITGPFNQIGESVPGFNFVTVQSFFYDSEFNTFQWVYMVRERLGKDRMELRPNGHWYRALTQDHTRSLLFGLKFVSVDEFLFWEGYRLDANGDRNVNDDRGQMVVRTDNDMIGFIVGGDLTWQHHRWNFGMRGNVGPFVNFARNRVEFTAIDEDTPANSMSANLTGEEDRLAVVSDSEFFARYHLCPNISVKAGWQLMFMHSVALAPDNISFRTREPGFIRGDGTLFITGLSLGVEGYW